MPTELIALNHWLLALALATPRLLVVLSIVPLFSGQTLGTMPRSAVAAALALPLLPLVHREIPPDLQLATSTFVVLLIKEACVGLLIGLLAAVPFWIAEAIGFIVDNQRGAAMAAMVNPMTSNESSPLGLLVYWGVVALFFSLGGMQMLLSMVYESYSLWPVSNELPAWRAGSAQRLLGVLDRLMYMAVVLASPMAVLMLLTEISLAILSTFAPQLQVFPLAMGIKSAVALFVLVLYATLLVNFLAEELHQMTSIMATLRALLQ